MKKRTEPSEKNERRVEKNSVAACCVVQTARCRSSAVESEHKEAGGRSKTSTQHFRVVLTPLGGGNGSLSIDLHLLTRGCKGFEGDQRSDVWLWMRMEDGFVVF